MTILKRFVREWKELAEALAAFDQTGQTSRAITWLYPGVRALAAHRVAHTLHQRQLKFLPWAISELSRMTTGVEISPGARIGRRVVIVHGTGTVIGATSVVGNDVVMLHGVTLGSRDIRNPPPGKRHPTIEDGATLCAGATILGNITVGRGAVVGANSVVLSDVGPGSTAIGAPARSSSHTERRRETA